MKVKAKNSNTDWALPGKSISLEEFHKGIRKAEDEPFHTIEESKKMIRGWRKK